MSAYNYHKRRTLDRLTGTYQARMREIMRKDAEAQVRDFVEALNAGRPSIYPDIVDLTPKVTGLFEAHLDRVIHVAVSDGIQEVTPDSRLGLWRAHPLLVPVEDTLSTDLADKRDKITDGIKKKVIRKNLFKLPELAKDHLSVYLRHIKQAYLDAAKDWIAGESTADEVARRLGGALRKTDSDSVMVLRTETTNYFNRTRHDYFSENTAADYIEIYAVTDGRISRICETRHGFVVTMERAGLKKYMPAFHPHCRTIQRALISTLSAHKPIITRGLSMNEASFAPLPKNWAA